VTLSVREQLASAERLIEQAAFSPVMEIPAGLSRLVVLLETARAGLADLPLAERGLAVAQLKSFRDKLTTFSLAMKRSEAIFQGYSRHAGVSRHEYGPLGGFNDVRDPAFFDLAV
jgi:hypothetical protein